MKVWLLAGAVALVPIVSQADTWGCAGDIPCQGGWYKGCSIAAPAQGAWLLSHGYAPLQTSAAPWTSDPGWGIAYRGANFADANGAENWLNTVAIPEAWCNSPSGGKMHN